MKSNSTLLQSIDKLGVFTRACPWGDIQSGKRVSSGPRRSLPDGARSRVEDAPGKEDEDSPVSSRFSSSCPASRTLRETRRRPRISPRREGVRSMFAKRVGETRETPGSGGFRRSDRLLGTRSRLLSAVK
ncbi:hypothetical protein P5V15_012076 [Pogonomyrmex californicus]